MELIPLALDGVFGLTSTNSKDERGSFLRVWDKTLLGMRFDLNQASAAVNPQAKTLRGLHFQEPPHAETKIIQCILGRVFDVLVDIRKESATYGEHISVVLGPDEKYQGVLAPKGFAHGYLTLELNSTLLYFMDQDYSVDAASGVVWNDPALQIKWPFLPEIISHRDAAFPHLKDL
jgi:dTDP-4-dehydrorhamnose 3,5-epimerase